MTVFYKSENTEALTLKRGRNLSQVVNCNCVFKLVNKD